MEKQHREKLADFKRNTKFKNIDGKSETLDAIIVRLRTAGFILPTEEVSYPEIITYCHPFLYMRYVVDWKSVKQCYIPRGHGDGMSFGKEVCKLWEELCWRNHFWNFDSFKCFKNIDELRDALYNLIGEDLAWSEGNFLDLEARLSSDKQNRDAMETAEKKKEAERKEQERLALIAENKAKEAARIAEEQRIKAAAEKAYRQAMAMKQNPVWSKTETTKKSKNKEVASPFVDDKTMVQAINPFEESDMSMLLAPLPDPKENEILLYYNCLKEACVAYGKFVEHGKHTARSFNGNNYICTEFENYSENNSQLFSQLLNFYGADRYLLFTLGDNESHNNSIVARMIIDFDVQ